MRASTPVSAAPRRRITPARGYSRSVAKAALWPARTNLEGNDISSNNTTEVLLIFFLSYGSETNKHSY